jgi:hypothetical protein
MIAIFIDCSSGFVPIGRTVGFFIDTIANAFHPAQCIAMSPTGQNISVPPLQTTAPGNAPVTYYRRRGSTAEP